ncbi:fungal specific transcription factor domain protein [Colletotrichum karsti]|uniref:Fungal specific transcription factor domain protein n=1 Tax=Colletotrichum karsti TaxID=1095194 RepID=A0A9P6I409_9PEZI|nr:fungal specific transcription factor domain protein [Colletotrichum karsti]KAF9876938.1 fungal specific transcription factor domain protein [Colletotrichum karsti]
MDADFRPNQLKIVPYQTPGQAPEAGKKRKRRWTQVEGHNRPSLKIRNACIACREKKTRCSGHMPCIRCQQHNRQCQYMPTTALPHPSEKRDSIANPAISPVEAATTISLDQQHSDGTQAPNFHDFSPVNPSSANEASGETPDGPLQEDQYGHFHGGASEFAFLHMAKQKLASLPSMSIRFSDYPLAESGDFPPIIPPKHIADKLLRVFFDFGLTTSRFVHEPSLVESFEKLYNDGQCDGLNNDNLALIYMVMTLGSHYSRVENMYCGYAPSVRFYHMADKQLQKDTSKITFASLQARMLATHYLLNHSRMHEAWSSFGIVVRHAQALGLHRRSIFGRPCAIHDDDIDQDECALANDEDITPTSCCVTADGDFCSAAAMLHYARLSRILGTILRRFYSPVARNSNVLQLYQAATDFERSLVDWQDNLPAYLNYVVLPPSALSTMTQRQTCTLKLMFAHASLLLYRPFMLYSMDPSTSAISRLEQWVKRCHDKSIEAAKMVVNECQYLCQRGLFSRVFWLVNYMQFAAVGTLYMYSHLWPEATHVRDTAEDAMAEFPVGVEGDLVGQRYVEILSELREITAKSTAMPSMGMDLLARACTVDELPAFDDSLMDFGGSFSNLFFDVTAMDEYIADHTR